MILIMAPVNMAPIAYFGLPSARIMEANVFCTKANGIMA